MRYNSLQDLIQNSSGSRRFFLSLSVPMQCSLHKYNTAVHSAAELHRLAGIVQNLEHMDALGKWKFEP